MMPSLTPAYQSMNIDNGEASSNVEASASNRAENEMRLLSMLDSAYVNTLQTTSGDQTNIEGLNGKKKHLQKKTAIGIENSTLYQDEKSKGQIHNLEYAWTFWITDPNKDWYSAIEKIGSFSTVHDFWRLFRYLKFPSEHQHFTYNLFKEGIRPEWEDPANAPGGKWTIGHILSGHRVDAIWIDLCLLCIGGLELGEYSSCINGIYVIWKKDGARVSVWLNTTDQHTVLPAGQRIQKCLEETLKKKLPMEFAEFRSSGGRNKRSQYTI